MKTINFFFITLILNTVSCTAQPKLENTLLWKISGNGLTEESYLFGTNHSVHHSFLDSIPGFWNTFDSAKKLLVEINIISQEPPTPPTSMVFLSKDSTYNLFYTNEEYQIVNNYIKLHNFGDLQEVNVKPSVMSLVVSNIIANDAANNIQSNETIDYHIITTAERRNIEILQLDDITNWHAQRYKIYNFNIPLKKQAEILLHIIKNENLLKETHKQVIQAYKQQNISELSDFNDTMRSLNQEIDSSIGASRNILWMEKIPEILKSGSSFIAVGALHLVGENGLIALLRKEGYTVEPITQNKN